MWQNLRLTFLIFEHQYDCYNDPIARRVVEKIENTTGIPDLYSEHLQLLKYVSGQYYKTHHDIDQMSMDCVVGPRIITFFLYLNDVEEGGATRFNDISGDKDEGLSIDVLPKKGMALIWPSVYDSHPSSRMDERTFHEALVVEKGTKYGANAWLRLRPYKNVDHCEELDELRGYGSDEEENDEDETDP